MTALTAMLCVRFILVELMAAPWQAKPIRQIKLPAALFVAVVLWILIQNATWTPDWMHHPIWRMTADALGRSVEGSISVDRELTSAGAQLL